MRRHISFGLALVAVAAATALLVHAADAPAPPKSPGPVFSLREFELKSGVDADQFDAFVRREVARVATNDSLGMKLRILKGDRGERKGRYLLIWEFESVAARNRCFPREGGGSSAEYQQAWDRMKAVMEKFGGFVSQHWAYTDYVQISD